MEFFKKHSGLFFGLCTVASLGIMCFVPQNHYSIAGGIVIVICAVVCLCFFLHKIYEAIDFRVNNKRYKFLKISDILYSITDDAARHNISIIYGKIDNFQDYDKNTLVILPANDSFDDDCVDDENSVLGSFVKQLYPTGNEIFKNKIKTELQKKSQANFDIGNWIYLRDIHNDKKFSVGIVSCTHLKEDGSIVAHSIDVMDAFQNGIFEIIKKNKPQKIYIPLICSGHGGLSPEISFLNLLISITEIINHNDQAHRLSNVNIVIYENDKGKRDIPLEKMKDIVKFVLNHCR
jgi:hypothetical protein